MRPLPHTYWPLSRIITLFPFLASGSCPVQKDGADKCRELRPLGDGCPHNTAFCPPQADVCFSNALTPIQWGDPPSALAGRARF